MDWHFVRHRLFGSCSFLELFRYVLGPLFPYSSYAKAGNRDAGLGLLTSNLRSSSEDSGQFGVATVEITRPLQRLTTDLGNRWLSSNRNRIRDNHRYSGTSRSRKVYGSLPGQFDVWTCVRTVTGRCIRRDTGLEVYILVSGYCHRSHPDPTHIVRLSPLFHYFPLFWMAFTSLGNHGR